MDSLSSDGRSYRATGIPCLVITAVTAVCAPVLLAQTPSQRPVMPPDWQTVRSHQPEGATSTLRLSETRAYIAGELIPIDLGGPGKPYRPGDPPHVEQWQFSGFLLSPAQDCGTVATPCYRSFGFSMDKGAPVLTLSHQPGPIRVFLNVYLPRLQPGHYQVAALFRELAMKGAGPMQRTYGYAEPPVHAVSEAIEIEIVPAPGGWVEQKVRESAARLRQLTSTSAPSGGADGFEVYQERRAVSTQLALLDAPPAWEAMLELLPAEENRLLGSLGTSAHPAEVCALMEQRLSHPQQAVSIYYLDAMFRLCGRPSLPAPPPDASESQRERYLQQWHALRARVLDAATETLAASLAKRKGEAKTIAIETLIHRIQDLGNQQPQAPLPEWTPILVREFTSTLAHMPPWKQRDLLGWFAAALPTRASELIPAAESLMDAWKPGGHYEVPQSALEALHTLSPKAAHLRIQAELRREKTWLSPELLVKLLPAEAKPALDDDAIVQGLERSMRPGGWNPRLQATAVALYAGAGILPRVRAIYEAQREPCQPELLAYFLRVDSKYAGQIVGSPPGDMQRPPSRCALRYFQHTTPLFMHPVLETYISSHLMHSDVFTKSTAARALGRYGTAAAEKPLWGAFRYIHNYWKDNPQGLERNGEGVNLEVELRNALARGRGWFTSLDALQRMEALCVSERCRYEAQNDMRAWQSERLPIEIMTTGSGFSASVAQYKGLDDVPALLNKLAQFPHGTSFRLRSFGQQAAAAGEQVAKVARSRGYTLEPEPQGRQE
jgi:hypothetical protein